MSLRQSGYHWLARYYDTLFPVSEALLDFLAPWIDACRRHHTRWLDVGCATGGLLERLEARGLSVYGLDPDAPMADQARARIRHDHQRVAVEGLEALDDVFAGRQFGVITCLGNVLAHAPDRPAIEAFARSARRRLVAPGVLIIQVVNFDRVLSQRHWRLPTLRRRADDGALVLFERRYDLDDRWEAGRLVFRTTLTSGAQRIENETLLTPQRRQRLEMCLMSVFPHVQVFGDYGRASWSPDSPATIIVASDAALSAP